MRQKSRSVGGHGEKVVKDIRRSDTQTVFSRREDPDRTDGLKGEESIAELCRREG